MTSRYPGHWTFLWLFLLVSGNASAKLEDVKPENKAACQLLGEVTGGSGYGKNPNWQPIARSYAERKASALGATHVEVVNYKAIGSFNGEATLKAYACP